MSPRPPAHGVGRDDLLTPRQLEAIVALATRRGLDANEMAQQSYRRQVVDLSVREAGVLIGRLQKMPATHAVMDGFTITNQPVGQGAGYQRELSSFLSTWGPHCGAPQSVFEGHLWKLLEAHALWIKGIEQDSDRKPPAQVTDTLKGMD